MKNFSQKINLYIVLMLLILPLQSAINAQENSGANYKKLYDKKEYKKSLNIINKQLNDIYITRVKDKRIPTGFISIKGEKNKKKDLQLLKKLFRNRKVEGFFIEDNKELSQLHLYAARCHSKINNFDESLSHYVQSLRFKMVEPKKDDIIYYEISQIFKKKGLFTGYIDMLDAASRMNTENYSYSLELGTVLYRTGMKKQAIYHLKRYLESTGDPIKPEVYLMLGNLYEDISKYLNTEKYYIEYLKKKPDDGYIHFALGYISYYRTGNYTLAESSFNKALSLLPEKEILKISKIYEYKADIAFHDLNFQNAVTYYKETIQYHEKIGETLNTKRNEVKTIDEKINSLKSSLLKEQDFNKFDLYESLVEKKGKFEFKLREIENEFLKFNAGKVRWNIAESLERLERYDEAIKYYRQVITYDFKANSARERIVKLKLKIKRGY